MDTCNTIVEDHKFTFINDLVDKFYKYMVQAYIAYSKNKADYEYNCSNSIDQTDIKKINDANKTFIEYFLYELFYNFGIKRRMVSENITLLYYSKDLLGYKPTEPITILCRHMLFDTSIMRIISLGIPKAIKLDEFCDIYKIDKANPETNFTNDVNKIPKYRLYKFSEGTMITYNPSLNKYSITTITSASDEIDIDIETDNIHNVDNIDSMNLDDIHKEIIDTNIEIKFNQQFTYSTRKVIGTGRFNSLKTFSEMFEENNKINNTNLQNIPEELIRDTVLVFNIEHPENRVISANTRNINTLCAVFKFKSEDISKEQFEKITNIKYSSDNEEIIKQYFKELGTDMITQIQVYNFKQQVKEYNVNLYLPEIIKKFKKTEINDIVTTNNYESLSFEEIETIIESKPNDFIGYIIYGINGERSKFNNNKYKKLLELKGNKPIVIEQWNTKNLFNLYWRLVKENKINEFIYEFDVKVGDNKFIYTKLFNWFLNLVRTYSFSLFKIYHNSFVKKTEQKSSIPFSMKPMCGDLHKLYISKRVPITPLIVETYIFSQTADKIFWRIFLDKK